MCALTMMSINLTIFFKKNKYVIFIRQDFFLMKKIEAVH